MTNDRAPTGTTAVDLETVRAVLAEAVGWTVEEVTDVDSPWIAAIGPDGGSRAIGREDGVYYVAEDNGAGEGWYDLANAWEAARVVASGGRCVAPSNQGSIMPNKLAAAPAVIVPFNDADLEAVRALFPEAGKWSVSRGGSEDGVVAPAVPVLSVAMNPAGTTTPPLLGVLEGRIVNLDGGLHSVIIGGSNGVTELGMFPDVMSAAKALRAPLMAIRSAELTVQLAVLEGTARRH